MTIKTPSRKGKQRLQKTIVKKYHRTKENAPSVFLVDLQAKPSDLDKAYTQQFDLEAQDGFSFTYITDDNSKITIRSSADLCKLDIHPAIQYLLLKHVAQTPYGDKNQCLTHEYINCFSTAISQHLCDKGNTLLAKIDASGVEYQLAQVENGFNLTAIFQYHFIDTRTGKIIDLRHEITPRTPKKHWLFVNIKDDLWDRWHPVKTLPVNFLFNFRINKKGNVATATGGSKAIKTKDRTVTNFFKPVINEQLTPPLKITRTPHGGSHA